MRYIKSIIIFCAICLSFVSCATTLNVIDSKSIPSNEDGYLAISFSEDTGFLQIIPSFHMYIINRENGDKFLLDSALEKKIDLYKIPAGSYVIKEIWYPVTRSNGTTSTSNIALPNEVLVPFLVKEGEITYLGDFNIKKNLVIIVGKGLELIWEKTNIADVEEGINKKYPNMKNMKINSVF